MLNNKEKAQIIESRIEQINYNIRDNIIQIDDIRSVYPVDEETINAIYFHIDEWTSKKVVLENELNKINIDDNKWQCYNMKGGQNDISINSSRKDWYY